MIPAHWHDNWREKSVRTPSPCPTSPVVLWASVPTWTAWVSETFRWPGSSAKELVSVDLSQQKSLLPFFFWEQHLVIGHAFMFFFGWNLRILVKRFKVSSPMILTGYAALNKLLGKNVYSSQVEPEIVHIDFLANKQISGGVWDIIL